MSDGRKGRGVRAARAISAFRKFGFEVVHVRGSHCFLKHPDGRIAVIPRHGTVKPGLLLDQVKKARIPWDMFEAEL